MTYDLSKPVDAIDQLSNEISSVSDNWNRDDWDDAADNLEAAINHLPSPLADDEISIIDAALTRMSVYAGRHKSEAEGLLSVINNYKKPVVQEAQMTPSTKPLTGLLQGYVIQEGGFTNVRKGPGSNYEIVTKIQDGSPVYYTVHNANWCVVYDDNGNTLGYMHSSKVVSSSLSNQNIPQHSVLTQIVSERYLEDEQGALEAARLLLKYYPNELTIKDMVYSACVMGCYGNASDLKTGSRLMKQAVEINKPKVQHYLYECQDDLCWGEIDGVPEPPAGWVEP